MLSTEITYPVHLQDYKIELSCSWYWDTPIQQTIYCLCYYYFHYPNCNRVLFVSNFVCSWEVRLLKESRVAFWHYVFWQLRKVSPLMFNKKSSVPSFCCFLVFVFFLAYVFSISSQTSVGSYDEINHLCFYIVARTDWSIYQTWQTFITWSLTSLLTVKRIILSGFLVPEVLLISCVLCFGLISCALPSNSF